VAAKLIQYKPTIYTLKDVNTANKQICTPISISSFKVRDTTPPPTNSEFYV